MLAENSLGETVFAIFAVIVLAVYMLASFKARLQMGSKRCHNCGGNEFTKEKELHWSANSGNLEKARTICAKCHTPIQV